MKNLIVINGTMGVGKTVTCEALLQILDRAVWLDGDWCWRMHPFQVTEETKAMVQDNIAHVLSNFLRASAYDHVIFCWVMHREEILSDVLSRLSGLEFRLHRVTLLCNERALRERIGLDIAAGRRDAGALARSLERMPLYEAMAAYGLDVSERTPAQAAELIARRVGPA